MRRNALLANNIGIFVLSLSLRQAGALRCRGSSRLAANFDLAAVFEIDGRVDHDELAGLTPSLTSTSVPRSRISVILRI